MIVRSPTCRREKREQTEERESETSGDQPSEAALERRENCGDDEVDVVAAAIVCLG